MWQSQLFQREFFSRAESLRSWKSGRPGRSEARREQPAGGGVSGAGPEFMSAGRAPCGHSYRPHGSWPQPRWGRWVRGGRALGVRDTCGAHFRITAGAQPFRPGVVPLCLRFRCRTRRRWAPREGVPGSDGLRVGGHGWDAGGTRQRTLGRKWGAWRRVVKGEARGEMGAGKLWLGRAACRF